MFAVTFEDVSAPRFTARTIERMYELIAGGVKDRFLQDLAARIVRGCPWKDYACFGQTLLVSTRKLVPYIPDPFNIERVQDAWTTLLTRRADCDDFTVFLSTLGAGIGFDYRIVTVKARRDPKTGAVLDEWSHVYPILSPPGGGWHGADATVKTANFGWEPQGYEKKIWEKP